jgi:hypothetical protein
MIGEQVKLNAVAAGGYITDATGATLGSPTWSLFNELPTEVVANYTPDGSTPEPLGAGGEALTSNPLSMYFLSQGPKTIKVTADVQLYPGNQPCLPGISLRKHAIRKPAALNGGIGPIFQMTAQTGYTMETMDHIATATTAASATVSPYGLSDGRGFTSICSTPPPTGITYYEGLHLGNGCKPHGIEWNYSVTVPSIGAGVIAMAQLVNTSLTYSTAAYSASYISNGFDLDTQYPYSGGLITPTVAVSGGAKASLVGALDAPVAYLTVPGANNAPGSGSCTTVKRNDTFEDYFLYQSSDSSRPSIPVTIAVMSWSWGGIATSTGGQQTWAGSSLVSPLTTLASTNAVDATPPNPLPTWPANIASLQNLIPSDPCAAPSPTPQARDRLAFSTSSAEGWIEYARSYTRASQEDIENAPRPGRGFAVYLKVQKPAPLWCVDYRDFKFDLRDHLGRSIPVAAPDHLSGAVAPGILNGLMGAVNTCAYSDVLRRDSGYAIRLDVLYPYLPVGEYTLKISLAPRDKSIPSIQLPDMVFRVVP